MVAVLNVRKRKGRDVIRRAGDFGATVSQTTPAGRSRQLCGILDLPGGFSGAADRFIGGLACPVA